MNWTERFVQNWRSACLSALLTALLGLFLWGSPLGQGFVRWSFDLPALLGPRVFPDEIVIVEMDELSAGLLQEDVKNWSRAVHAQLLRKLTADGSRLVVFDVYFPDTAHTTNDALLAEAIRAHGQVVLAVDLSPLSGLPGYSVSPPLQIFREAARDRWGISGLDLDWGPFVRRHYPGTDQTPSLPWAAAEVLGAAVTKQPEVRLAGRWLCYYGNRGELPTVSYAHALNKPPGFFRDKIVFIGGRPKTQAQWEEVDEFHTPFTNFGGSYLGGVQLEATSLLNLLYQDWLRRLPGPAEFLLLIVCGVLFGFGLTLTRPFPALVWAVLGFLAIAVAAGVLYLPPHRLWFPWLLMAAIQIPCAWLCAVAVHTQNLYREKAALERRLTERASTPPAVQAATPGIEPTEDACEASSPTRTMEQAHTLAIPAIADHKLLRQVGKGAYGEVWLAQNAIGLFHAVKIVYRRHFKEAAPYEREFKGIQKYMPISLNHPSLTHVLHVGRNDQAGHFYYIMEVGDDQNTGTSINPQVYSPRNFAKDLEKRGRLTVPECVELFLELTAALQYLHGQELIHRDIKPSNIIFVKGQPKFADIGLVTEIRAPGRDTTFIGTEGYMAPEGPGAPAADLYGLGKVLYVAATGLDRRRFPEWPERLPDRPPQKEWAELRAIILKACESDPKRRYQSAAEIRRDLEQLRQQIKSG